MHHDGRILLKTLMYHLATHGATTGSTIGDAGVVLAHVKTIVTTRDSGWEMERPVAFGLSISCSPKYPPRLVIIAQLPYHAAQLGNNSAFVLHAITRVVCCENLIQYRHDVGLSKEPHEANGTAHATFSRALPFGLLSLRHTCITAIGHTA
eukprot:4843634-Amphidinium_carterae.1